MSYGRPTLYRGIRMRSRLEASYAAHLDADAGLYTWSYEPDCFAAPAGQWLPDFRIEYTTNPIDWEWVELKPAGMLKGKKPHEIRALIDSIIQRMETAWATSPHITLSLVFWEYDGSKQIRIWSNSQKSGWRFPVSISRP